MNFVFAKKNKGDILDEKQHLRTHGKDLWTVLHTTSVFLGEKLNAEESETYKDFVFGVLYFGTKPNKTWHDLTMKYISDNPLDIKDRDNAMMWTCKLHNHVNLNNDKDLFECTIDNIAKRWGNYSAIINKNNLTL